MCHTASEVRNINALTLCWSCFKAKWIFAHSNPRSACYYSAFTEGLPRHRIIEHIIHDCAGNRRLKPGDLLWESTFSSPIMNTKKVSTSFLCSTNIYQTGVEKKRYQNPAHLVMLYTRVKFNLKAYRDFTRINTSAYIRIISLLILSDGDNTWILNYHK